MDLKGSPEKVIDLLCFAMIKSRGFFLKLLHKGIIAQ